jgi:hypothetical protein
MNRLFSFQFVIEVVWQFVVQMINNTLLGQWGASSLFFVVLAITMGFILIFKCIYECRDTSQKNTYVLPLAENADTPPMRTIPRMKPKHGKNNSLHFENLATGGFLDTTQGQVLTSRTESSSSFGDEDEETGR